MVLTCSLCPRRCAAVRPGGFCGASPVPEASAVCLHRGEEPVFVGNGRGMVNIFFAHCNLQCIYCQNGAISGRRVADDHIHYRGADAIADAVCRLLPKSAGTVGFVTAAHYADRLHDIADAIHRRGFHPVYVYNSSGYESVEALRSLEGLVDVYLPDFKYMDPDLAALCSHAPDYPEVAQRAILEMKRQVGGGLKVDSDTGTAYRGMVVRHLVLPGAAQNTRLCLEWLADNFTPFTLHLALMAQYFPPREGLPAPLDRRLTDDEYAAAADLFDSLGFAGWLQETSSQMCFRPDFSNPINPFGDETEA